jgi:hypothetical protein
MTYGTFGMWGALLSGGHNLMPKSHAVNKVADDAIIANISGWDLL